MLVALGIMAVLASAAVPFAETMITREKEAELRTALRVIRKAIDAFHEDLEKGRISSSCNCYSENGYPVSLELLAEGVVSGRAEDRYIRYLRRIPRDPFSRQDIPPAEQWGRRGYDDSTTSLSWNGSDVYDVYSKSEKKARDGSYYADW